MLKRFSRRALYELIWSKPMRDAAAENSISDVGLVKICRAAGIPTPPQGHWNKLRAGKPTVQIELPPRPPGVSDEVTFGGGNYYTAGYRTQPESQEDYPPPVLPCERATKRAPRHQCCVSFRLACSSMLLCRPF